MHCYSGKTFAHVLDSMIDDLIYNPDYICKPRNQEIREMINVSFEIENPKYCLFENKHRSSPVKYIAHELLLYYSQSRQVEDFEKASKFWSKLANGDNTINSAYGNLILTNGWKSQWNWAKKSLIKDKDSRQAIMHYNNSSHQYSTNKDFVCTMYNQFFIRNNKLHLSVFMRSQDIHFGIQPDVPWFYSLMECMKMELLPYYPELEIGSYYHSCGSLHMYERNFEIYEKARNYIFVPQEFPTIDINLAESKSICEDILKNNHVNLDSEILKWLTYNAFN